MGLDAYIDILNSNVTLTSCLFELFGKHVDAIVSYIKVGREFWHYDTQKGSYRKLKVVYVRTGVMFFEFEDEPNVEYAWFIKSINCFSLCAAQIYPYEIGEILSAWNKNAKEQFPILCKKCKWDDYDGKIKVEVIWN